jgi:hypothetical protein
MVARPPFLNTAYCAYHHRDRPPEELIRVGTGTPCGEYLRCFWQPIILSSELASWCGGFAFFDEGLCHGNR